MPCPPTALAPSGSPPPNNNPTNPFFLRLMQQGHPLDMDPPFTRTDGRCAVTIRVCCPRRWHHVDADLPNSLSLPPSVLSLSPSLPLSYHSWPFPTPGRRAVHALFPRLQRLHLPSAWTPLLDRLLALGPARCRPPQRRRRQCPEARSGTPPPPPPPPPPATPPPIGPLKCVAQQKTSFL